MREQEHKKDMKQLEGQSNTRARKRQSETVLHQSYLTNHAGHTIDWEGARLSAKEPNYKKRGITEAITIQKARANVINQDSGHHL